MSVYRGRFAPSPTGALHAGSLLTALVSWLLAKQAHGQWLVRIEDIDPPRAREGAVQSQLATLHAYGLHADGNIVYQSQRSQRYQAALDQLLAAGHAFECHCSRRTLQAAGGIHRICVAHEKRPDPAIRLRVPDGCQYAFTDALYGHYQQRIDTDVGDFVLRRSDGLWAYQLAVVVDDAEQHITDVVRGADLLDSTPRQIMLQHLLGLPTPRYLHLPLLCDASGSKLSKSLDAWPVRDDQPLPLLYAVWAHLQQSPFERVDNPAMFLEKAVQLFDLTKLPKEFSAFSAAAHNSFFTHPA